MANDWGQEWRLVPPKGRESCRWQTTDLTWNAWVSLSLGYQGDITKIVIAASDGRSEVVDGYEEGLNLARRWRLAWSARRSGSFEKVAADPPLPPLADEPLPPLPQSLPPLGPFGSPNSRPPSLVSTGATTGEFRTVGTGSTAPTVTLRPGETTGRVPRLTPGELLVRPATLSEEPTEKLLPRAATPVIPGDRWSQTTQPQRPPTQPQRPTPPTKLAPDRWSQPTQPGASDPDRWSQPMQPTRPGSAPPTRSSDPSISSRPPGPSIGSRPPEPASSPSQPPERWPRAAPLPSRPPVSRRPQRARPPLRDLTHKLSPLLPEDDAGLPPALFSRRPSLPAKEQPAQSDSTHETDPDQNDKDEPAFTESPPRSRSPIQR